MIWHSELWGEAKAVSVTDRDFSLVLLVSSFLVDKGLCGKLMMLVPEAEVRY